MKRRMLTIVLAALLGVVGIVAVLAYANKANDRAIKNYKAVSVLAANQSIPTGTSVGQAWAERMLVPIKYPVGAVPANAVFSRSVSHLNTKLVTTSAMEPGQLLTTLMLGHRGQVSGGGIAVPTGFMAVSAAVCLQAAIAGHVQPGAWVALFDTYSKDGSQIDSSCDGSHQGQVVSSVYTRMLLTRVQVLSVSATPPGSDAAGQGTTPVSTGASGLTQGVVYVTLAVSQKQAERLISASEGGLPYFALLTTGSVSQPDEGTPLFP